MTDPANKLEACPFCGNGEPIVWLYREENKPPVEPVWIAHCKACNITVQKRTKYAAVATWNTRAAPEPPLTDAGREALAIKAKWGQATARHSALLRDNEATDPKVKRSGERCAALYASLSQAAIAALAHHPAQDVGREDGRPCNFYLGNCLRCGKRADRDNQLEPCSRAPGWKQRATPTIAEAPAHKDEPCGEREIGASEPPGNSGQLLSASDEAAIRAENVRLRDALEPFAELAGEVLDRFMADNGDALTIGNRKTGGSFAFISGHAFKRAARALATPDLNQGRAE